jgi:hypothetical protein
MAFSDRELLARTLQAEAGNQGPAGMLAAGSVIMNRTKTQGYGDGLQGVIMKPGQFSVWNGVTGYAGGEQGQDMAAMTPSGSAYAAADTLIGGQYNDPTGGATHYYNPSISQPNWGIDNGGNWTRIGDHVFGNANAQRGNTQARVSTRNAQTPNTNNAQTGGILSNEGNQMDRQPQGLLGSMGIQRRDPNAQGETSQPFYNRQSFGDTLARMAPALGRMGVMGLEGPAQAALDTRNQRQGDERAKQAQAAQRNQTAEWFRSQGGDKWADGVLSGSLTGAQALSGFQAEAAQNAPMSEMEQIQLETARFGLDELRNPTPEVDREGEAKLRREFTSLPIVKSFSDQSTAYGRVMASVNDPSPAGDLALIFNFMKVLDPGSTVREGEFATAANSGGVDDRVRALYNNVTEGTRLAPKQRDDFANRATQLYSNAEQQYQGIADQYSAFATQSGYNPATMMPDFTYSGDRYQTPMSLTPPQLTGPQLGQLGISRADWPDVWANMTVQERQELAGAN